MRAIVVDQWMEPRDLVPRDVPDPEVGRGMLGVDVRAAGCNFFDILMVRGQYQMKPPFPFVPGAELAGVVREVGPGAGGFAERAAVPAAAAWKMPDRMSFDAGASLPIVYPTSYAGLVFRADLHAGE